METVVEFVIDLSQSMEDKIDLTKQILLSDIIPYLDYSSKIGIKSFSGVKDKSPITQELPLSIIDRESILLAIRDLKVKNGGTPISEAIRQSIISLKEHAVNNKKIILVTDGEEDRGGDYVAECEKAKSEGINCEIHVVGIGLNPQSQTKAKEISTLTKGSFSDIPFAKGSQYNQTIIKNSLSTFYNAVNPNKATSSINSVPEIIQTSKEFEVKANNLQPTDSIESVEENSIGEIPLVVGNNKDIEILNEEANALFQTLITELKGIKEDMRSLKSINDTISDIVEDVELNEKIRLISENYLFEILKVKYPNRVKWINEKGETGSNHDFEILEEDGGVEYYIECKGTAKNKRTFYITKNEWNLFLNNTKNYQIYFIQNVLGNPNHIFINNLLDWLLKGKVYPYLKSRDIVKEERVFITISDSNFII